MGSRPAVVGVGQEEGARGQGFVLVSLHPFFPDCRALFLFPVEGWNDVSHSTTEQQGEWIPGLEQV